MSEVDGSPEGDADGSGGDRPGIPYRFEPTTTAAGIVARHSGIADGEQTGEAHVHQLVRVGNAVGGTVALEKRGELRIRGRAVGRSDFERIELIQNGGIVAVAASRKMGGHHEATIDTRIDISRPGWFALRTPPPSVSGDSSRSRKTPLNLIGRELFEETG